MSISWSSISDYFGGTMILPSIDMKVPKKTVVKITRTRVVVTIIS